MPPIHVSKYPSAQNFLFAGNVRKTPVRAFARKCMVARMDGMGMSAVRTAPELESLVHTSQAVTRLRAGRVDGDKSGDDASMARLSLSMPRSFGQIRAEVERATDARYGALQSENATRAAATRLLAQHGFGVAQLSRNLDAVRMQAARSSAIEGAFEDILAQAGDDVVKYANLQSAGVRAHRQQQLQRWGTNASYRRLERQLEADGIALHGALLHEFQDASAQRQCVPTGTQRTNDFGTGGNLSRIAQVCIANKPADPRVWIRTPDASSMQSYRGTLGQLPHSLAGVAPDPVYVDAVCASYTLSDCNRNMLGVELFRSVRGRALRSALAETPKDKSMLLNCIRVLQLWERLKVESRSKVGLGDPPGISRALLENHFLHNMILSNNDDHDLEVAQEQAEQRLEEVGQFVNQLCRSSRIPHGRDSSCVSFHGLPFWATLFFCLRSGSLKSAQLLLNRASNAAGTDKPELGGFVVYFEEWCADSELVIRDAKTLQRMFQEYLVVVRKGRDTFRRLCYAVLFRLEMTGRLELAEEDYKLGLNSVEDWLWFRLVCTRPCPSTGHDSSTSMSSIFGPTVLPELKDLVVISSPTGGQSPEQRVLDQVKAFGAANFADDTMLMYVFILLVLGDFQGALSSVIAKVVELDAQVQAACAGTAPRSRNLKSPATPVDLCRRLLRLIEDTVHLFYLARFSDLHSLSDDTYATLLWSYMLCFADDRLDLALTYCLSLKTRRHSTSGQILSEDDLSEELELQLLLFATTKDFEMLLTSGSLPSSYESILISAGYSPEKAKAVCARVAFALARMMLEERRVHSAVELFEKAGAPGMVFAVLLKEVTEALLFMQPLLSSSVHGRLLSMCRMYLRRFRDTHLNREDETFRSSLEVLLGVNQVLVLYYQKQYEDAIRNAIEAKLLPASEAEVMSLAQSFKAASKFDQRSVPRCIADIAVVCLDCLCHLLDMKDRVRTSAVESGTCMSDIVAERTHSARLLVTFAEVMKEGVAATHFGAKLSELSLRFV
ncbi:Nuclear pore complex protein Nup93 [Porphyridium purpureum]|uniref:Nuclear pore complex protein Nup93 n=1 Tax=Porphyridium purpureum TaxID=35688 RepID=A0A5J4YRV7_PORPP|nr:Nuclear pore complex protein Nup93 [Porphyridium purpureum]|eukprot:POR9824..scf236_6